MKTMKAATRRSYGLKNLIIETVDLPTPKPDEVLVKVVATTVNRTDCANLTAKPFIMRFVFGIFNPKNKFIGTDFAGVVAEVGDQVKLFKVGDKVFGFHDMVANSQAEYLVIKEDGFISAMPHNLNFQEATASIEGAHYAYTFIHKTNIQPGEKVLINGATGAIGSALLQLTRQFDVHITATCNTKNIELIKSLGANEVIDYTQEDFTKTKVIYDYVFDAVGKSSFGKCKRIIKKGGVYSSSELGPYAENLLLALTSKVIGSRKVIFPIPYPIPTTMAYIKDMVEKGIFKPVIDREYNFETIAEAYEYVLTGEKTGNVVLNMGA